MSVNTEEFKGVKIHSYVRKNAKSEQTPFTQKHKIVIKTLEPKKHRKTNELKKVIF